MSGRELWRRGPFPLTLDKNNPIPADLLEAAPRQVGGDPPSPPPDARAGSSITLDGTSDGLPDLLCVRLGVDWLSPGPNGGDIHPPLVTELIESLILARWWEASPHARDGIVTWRPTLRLEWPPELVERASLDRSQWPGGHIDTAETAPPSPPAALATSEPIALLPPTVQAEEEEEDQDDLESLGARFWTRAPEPDWVERPEPSFNSLVSNTSVGRTLPPSEPPPAPEEDSARPQTQPVTAGSSLWTCVELHLSVHRRTWHEATYRLLRGAQPTKSAQSSDPVFSAPIVLPFLNAKERPGMGVVGNGWLSRELVARDWLPPSAQAQRWRVHLPWGGALTRDMDGALRLKNRGEDRTFRPNWLPKKWLERIPETPSEEQQEGWVHLPRRLVSRSWVARTLVDTTPPLLMGALFVAGLLWSSFLVAPQAMALKLRPLAKVSAPSGCVLSNPSFVDQFRESLRTTLSESTSAGGSPKWPPFSSTEELRVAHLCALSDKRSAEYQLDRILATSCHALEDLPPPGESEVARIFDGDGGDRDDGLIDLRDGIARACDEVHSTMEAQTLGAVAGSMLYPELLSPPGDNPRSLHRLGPQLVAGLGQRLKPVPDELGELFLTGMREMFGSYQLPIGGKALWSQLRLKTPELTDEYARNELEESVLTMNRLRQGRSATLAPDPLTSLQGNQGDVPPRALWSCAAELLGYRPMEPSGTGAFGVELGRVPAVGSLNASQLELDAAKAAPNPSGIPSCWQALLWALPDYTPAWPQSPIAPELETAAQSRELGAQVCENWARLVPHGVADPEAGAASSPLIVAYDLQRIIGVQSTEDSQWPLIALPDFGLYLAAGDSERASSRTLSVACSCHLLEGEFLPTPDGLPQSLTDLLQPSISGACLAKPEVKQHSQQSCSTAALMCGLSELLPLSSKGSASPRHLNTQWTARFLAGEKSENPWCSQIGPLLDIHDDVATLDQRCAEGVREVREELMPALIADLVRPEAAASAPAPKPLGSDP